jgi:hypothetical protein
MKLIAKVMLVAALMFFAAVYGWTQHEKAMELGCTQVRIAPDNTDHPSKSGAVTLGGHGYVCFTNQGLDDFTSEVLQKGFDIGHRMALKGGT